MPDSPDKSLSPQPAKSSKEMSMEVRLLIAFLLMGGILFLTPYIYKPPTPAKPAAAPAATGNASAEKPAAAVTPAAPIAPAAPPAGQVAGAAEAAYVVDTTLYRIVFSNRGAVVKSWTLKKYKDSAGKPLELIDTAAGGGAPEPFSLLFVAHHAPSTDPNSALFATKPASD